MLVPILFNLIFSLISLIVIVKQEIFDDYNRLKVIKCSIIYYLLIITVLFNDNYTILVEILSFLYIFSLYLVIFNL